MTSEERGVEPGAIIAERCPICGTLMTAEQAGPIRFPAARHQMILPDARIGEGQTVTRMRCENGHTFWAIEDDPDEQ